MTNPKRTMADILLDSRVEECLAFLESRDGLARQAQGVAEIKKTKALGNFGIAILMLVLGILASGYGAADVIGKEILPMGPLFLIGGPIMVLGGVYMIFSSLVRAATASQIEFQTNLEQLCRDFYLSVFCKKTTDFGTKANQIVDVCQAISLPVLEMYRSRGWDALLGKQKGWSESRPIECSRCQKKAEHSKTHYTSIPIYTKFREEFRHEESAETQHLIRNLYLRCQSCGIVTCYECVAYSTPKHERFLCPSCGKGTNGWDGLADRWMKIRYAITDQDVDFLLSSVTVDTKPRLADRVFDVTIHLRGSPFGKLSLKNIAFHIEGRWFLATLEPVLSNNK
ncbi:MAG TPA: hypothetical protein PLX23_04125 [Candidatus Hydrogenedens sp.]|nr:hypothetical protein [Candidatus Hydrogenedens sp.]